MIILSKIIIAGPRKPMQSRQNIREEMHRYPIFSYHQDPYVDESEMFKDEDIKNTSKQNLTYLGRNQVRNQTIVSIYDRILINHTNNPISQQTHPYIKRDHPTKQTNPQKQKKQQRHSTVTTARNSRCDIQQGNKKNRTNAITKFMGQIASSINKQELSDNTNRPQKISLLKRIIQHYNIKSVERKYYSNLIKNFGLKIEAVNGNQIAVRKSLHPREKQSRILVDNSGVCSQVELIPNDQPINVSKRLTSALKRPTIPRNSKPSTLLHKDYSFHLSRSRQHLNSQKSKMLIPTQSPNPNLTTNNSKKIRQSIEYSTKLLQKPLKIQPSTSIQDKINKYRDFLFIVNMSNFVYQDLDVQKYQKSVKFYVGSGNNANLIKSLMRKRFWFEETHDIAQANFVWTQIKVQEVFGRQRPAQKEESEIQLTTNWTTNQQPEQPNPKTLQPPIQLPIKPRKLLQHPRSPSSPAAPTHTKSTKFNKSKSKAKDYAPQDPIHKILTYEDSKYYRQISQALIFKKFPTFFDRFRTCPKKLKFQGTSCGVGDSERLVHNHFCCNGLLGNKKALFYNMKQYCRLTNKKLSDYIPPTYHIKTGLTDPSYKSLSNQYQQQKKEKAPNFWIIKPGEYSNRGQGITCTNKLEDIRSRVLECRREIGRKGKGQGQDKDKDKTLIVQKYIDNPLLYYGRKFDIRVFMMITSRNGKIKGYWYQDGYVRTSSFEWSLNEMEDKYVHLTNDAVQKTCEQYGRYEPGNKLTFTDLQRYLHSLPKNGRNLQFFSAIYPQLRQISTDTIKSTYLNLDRSRLQDNFQLFGLDFMIDEQIKPYLIEVNTNPCLQLNCPILQRILPHMVQNSLRICLDTVFPPPSVINSEYKYSIPENAVFYNKFQLVFDQQRDGDQLTRLYKGVDPKLFDEFGDIEEEEQEIYEDEGKIVEVFDQ